MRNKQSEAFKCEICSKSIRYLMGNTLIKGTILIEDGRIGFCSKSLEAVY